MDVYEDGGDGGCKDGDEDGGQGGCEVGDEVGVC